MQRPVIAHRSPLHRNARFRSAHIRSLGLAVACTLAAGFVRAQEDLYVYATNLVSDNVSVYSTNADGTLSAVTTFGSVGSGPAGVAIRGDQAFMYVAGTNGDSLHVVDTRTNTVVQNITSGLNGPWGLAVSPDGKRLYVPNHDANTVSDFTIDTLSGQLTAASTITVGTQARAVAFSPDGTKAYVINQGSSNNGSVSVIDVAAGTVTATVATTTQLTEGVVSSDGTRLFVAYTRGIHYFDTATNTITSSVPFSTEVRGIDVNNAGTKVYVTRVNDQSVSVLDVATEDFTPQAAAGQQPMSVTLSPAGAYAYVAGNTSNNIPQFSVDAVSGGLTPIGSDAAGTSPFAIAICQRGDGLLASGNTFVAHTGAALGCTGSSAEFTGGTLLVNADNQIFATPISIGTGGGTIDTNGNDATIASVISGSAALTKAGTGTLTLTGANTHTGTVDVDAGTLQVNGTLDSSRITIAAGASLTGSGVIHGNVVLMVGATLSGVTVNGTVSGPGVPVVIPVNVVSGLMRNVYLQGFTELTTHGVIDGGYLEGTVTSSGLITGAIRLGPDTSITGGMVSGSLIGLATSPARVTADIAAGTVLENVRVLRGSRIDTGVLLGRNVVIEDAASIPATLDMTRTLESVPERDDARHVPLLDDALSHPAGSTATPGTILDDMQMLDALASANATLTQNARGELLLAFDDLRSTLLPLQVRLATGIEEGIHIQDDGSVLFALGWYTVLAVPVPADDAVLAGALLAGGLNLDTANRIGATQFVRALNPFVSDYFAFRPGLYTMPAGSGEQAGLQPVTLPGMPAPYGLTLVFEDQASASLRTQELLPVPADWQALKAHLGTMAGVTSADLGADGVITVTLPGQTLRVRAAYRVVEGSGSAMPLVLEGAGDQNGDGLSDYRVVYPNGDSQLLHRLPEG